MAVPALNFDFVRGESGRVPHDKGVPFDEMLPPVVLHPGFLVAHFVLKAWAIVFNRQERLQQDTWLRECFKTVRFNKQTCPVSYLPADVHLMRKMALDFDIFGVSIRSFEGESVKLVNLTLFDSSLLLFKVKHMSLLFSKENCRRSSTSTGTFKRKPRSSSNMSSS